MAIRAYESSKAYATLPSVAGPTRCYPGRKLLSLAHIHPWKKRPDEMASENRPPQDDLIDLAIVVDDGTLAMFGSFLSSVERFCSDDPFSQLYIVNDFEDRLVGRDAIRRHLDVSPAGLVRRSTIVRSNGFPLPRAPKGGARLRRGVLGLEVARKVGAGRYLLVEPGQCFQHTLSLDDLLAEDGRAWTGACIHTGPARRSLEAAFAIFGQYPRLDEVTVAPETPIILMTHIVRQMLNMIDVFKHRRLFRLLKKNEGLDAVFLYAAYLGTRIDVEWMYKFGSRKLGIEGILEIDPTA